MVEVLGYYKKQRKSFWSAFVGNVLGLLGLGDRRLVGFFFFYFLDAGGLGVSIRWSCDAVILAGGDTPLRPTELLSDAFLLFPTYILHLFS